MDDQEFVNETVFDKRIIKSPAKRNYRPNGTGRGGDAAFCSIGLPGRDYPVFHKSDQAEICKNALPDFFLRFLRAGTCITLPGNWGRWKEGLDMQDNRDGYGFDRSWLPYDAMGDYSVFAHQTEEKERCPRTEEAANRHENAGSKFQICE